MNLAKAREILQLNVPRGKSEMPPDVKEALRLGIEAQTLVLELRSLPGRQNSFPLPGETPE